MGTTKYCVIGTLFSEDNGECSVNLQQPTLLY